MLNKTEFIDYISENYDTTKKNATEIVDTFITAFSTATKECGGVNLRGFISSSIVDIPKKEYMNPRNGEKFISPAHSVVKIKISKNLKNIEE